MTGEGSGTGGEASPPPWCPQCLATVGDLALCPACGLGQRDPEAARLRVVVARLDEIHRAHEALLAEWSALDTERTALLAALRGTAVPPQQPVRWRPERVRDTLLWLGVTLLGLAALAFAIVTWSRLGDTGRGLLLLGATTCTAVATVGLHHRLRATAEALAGLTLALVLVDWHTLRRAGFGTGLDGTAWWAAGTALVALLGLAAARMLGLTAARSIAATAGLAAAGLAVPATTDAAWTGALVSATGATAATVAACRANGRAGRRALGAILRAGAVGLDLAALGLALTALAAVEGPGPALTPALAILGVGFAPATAVGIRLRYRSSPSGDDALVLAAAASALGALIAVWVPGRAPGALAVLAAGLGLGAVATARAVPAPLSRGLALAGGSAVALGFVTVAGDIGRVVTGPHAWFADPWTGSVRLPARAHVAPGAALSLRHGRAAAAVLTGVAAAGLAAAVPLGRRAALLGRGWGASAVLGGTATAAVVLLQTSSAPVGVVLGAHLALIAALVATAVAFERRGPAPAAVPIAVAAGVGIPGAGWAAVSEAASVVALAAVVAIAATAGLVLRDPWSRILARLVAAGAVVAEVAVVTAVVAPRRGPVGVAVALAAASVLVAGALARRDRPDGPPLEALGLVGIIAGLALAAASSGHLAVALTSAAAALGAAGLAPRRPAYPPAATAGVIGAIWAWLAAAGVSLLEAYTLPAAAVLLTAGVLRRRARPALHSWAAYGPGIALAIGPSLAVAVPDGGVARPLALTAGGLLAVGVGARHRLGAPLVLGGSTLLVLAVDALGPVAWRAPRWALLAVAGLVLLWLGAGAERRLEQLRRWRGTARTVR